MYANQFSRFGRSAISMLFVLGLLACTAPPTVTDSTAVQVLPSPTTTVSHTATESVLQPDIVPAEPAEITPLEATNTGADSANPISSIDTEDDGNRGVVQPGVIARVTVAEDPFRILDFRHDPVSGRLFATTTDNRLSVLDGNTLDIIHDFPFGGELALDEEGRRLYITPGSQYIPEGEPIQINIIDLDNLDVVGMLEGLHYVSIDHENRRLFAGSPVRAIGDGRDSGTVQVYDLDSLELLYKIDQQGIPTYNPYRDELIITSYTTLVVDPDTGSVLEDLLPELSEQPFRWCNGCEHASNAHIVEPERLLVIERTKSSTGGGPGFSPEDIYLDARTLQAVDSFALRFPFQATCSTKRIPLRPIAHQMFWQQRYVRYVVYRNFDVHNIDGEVETWRDGLFAPYINPRTNQAYTTQGYVLGLESLEPVGRLPVFCTLDEDASTGRIFGRTGGDLIVLDEDGGMVATAVPTEPEPLPAASITQIIVSPDYPADPTIFLLLEDSRLYRTSDGGRSWLRIQGGLPAHDSLRLIITLSPTFGADRTLYAGGFIRDYRGEGVLVSDDAGNTWKPLWNGLSHLRVYGMQISPTFSEDGTIHAFSRYNRLSPWEEGVSLHTSTDRGLSWSQVITAANESELAAMLTASGTITHEDVPIRIADFGSTLEVQDSNGKWQLSDLEQKEGEMIRALVQSPAGEQNNTYYALGDYSLWRTTDSGQTWERWRDPRLAGRDYDNALTTLTVTPLFPDGSYQLLVGTHAGEFWMLSPPNDKAELDSQTDSGTATEDAVDPQSEITPTATIVTPVPDIIEAQPPEGKFRPGGALASIWDASPDTRASLGWALTELAATITAAYQPFERGAMIWNGDSGSVIVLYDDGTWQTFADAFEEGEPEFDPALNPPDGTLQPIRGFGKLWRTTESVRDNLGWALAEEKGYPAYIHTFEHGYLLSTPFGTLQLIRETETGGRWR